MKAIFTHMLTRFILTVLPALVLVLAACAESGDGPGGDVFNDYVIDQDYIAGDVDVISDIPVELAPECGSEGTCPTGQTCCPDNRCYNLTNDPTNCGECGKSCYPKGNICIAGNCSCNGAAPCSTEGWICCASGGCLDPNFDTNNCGECGHRCPEGQPCVGGSCGGTCESTGCPEVDHGTSDCVDGVCVIIECEEGWSDGDGVFENGCECSATTVDNGGTSCDAAYDLGELHDTEPGSSVVVEGFCSTLEPEDWYRFNAVDDPDTACDNFHIDIRFLSNPGRAYCFDVIQASCTSGTYVCENDTEYEMVVDTRQRDGAEYWGECPCKAVPDADSNLCMDNSSPFFVVVKLAEGADEPGCEPYRMEVSNGKYDYTP